MLETIYISLDRAAPRAARDYCWSSRASTDSRVWAGYRSRRQTRRQRCSFQRTGALADALCCLPVGIKQDRLSESLTQAALDLIVPRLIKTRGL